MRQLLFWILWHVPLGPLAPWIMGLALGKMPHKLKSQEAK